MRKLLFLLVGLFIVFSTTAQETKSDLKTRFDVIRNETVAGANTKTRIANAYQELADASQGIYYIEASGSATYTASLLNLDAYADKWFVVQFLDNNTGTSTLNINSLGAVTIKKDVTTNLSANDIDSLSVHILAYDGTNMQILTLGGGSGGGVWGTITGTTTDQTDITNVINAKVADAINNGTTTIAPSQNAVFDALALKRDLSDTYNTQTASYPLVLSDAGKVVEMNVGSANDVTVPLNSSVAYPVGTSIVIVQKGAGLTSVVATGGVTINTSAGSLDSPGQNAVMVLSKRATDEWYLWNGSAAGGSGSVTSIATTSPITGGTITTTGTIGINNAAADGSTKGAASFTANDFDASSGNIGIDYTNGQAASGSVKGFLSSSDWTAFNNTWRLSGTSTLTGTAAIASNTADQLSFGGAWTASANNQFHANFGGTFTARGTTTDNLYGYKFTPSLVAGAANQVLTGLIIAPTYTPGAHSPLTPNSLQVNAMSTSSTTNAMSIHQSDGTQMWRYRGDNAVYMGSTTNLGIGPASTAVNYSPSSTIMTFANSTNIAGGSYGFHFYGGATWNANTGSNPGVLVNIQSFPTQTSGTNTVNYEQLRIMPTYNFTAAGATATVWGLRYIPTLTSMTSTTHYAIYTGSGSVLFGNSNTDAITASTRQDVRGTGTTTGNTLRLADSGNAANFLFKDNGDFQVDKTITAGGTTGDRTIDKLAGTVNFAAAASSITVTNALVTTSSLIFCVIRTNDTTAEIKNVVPGAGSFVITLSAAATAETSVGFFIVN